MKNFFFFFFSSRRRHTRLTCDWSSDVCSSDLDRAIALATTGAEVLALHVYPPSLDRGMVSHFEIEPENLDATFARMVLSAVVQRFAAHGLEVATLVLVGH